MNGITSTRLSSVIEKGIDVVAKTENLDKSTVIRRLLTVALTEWRKDQAIKLYKENRTSIEKAAKFAEMSLWGFFDLLHKRKIPINYDLEELEKDIKNA